MTAELAIMPQPAPDLTAIERVIVAGDLSRLSADERWSYYRGVCQSLGLNPFTKPFDYINLGGKLVLYAKKDCADQLRKLQGVSIDITARERIDDLYVVTARATSRDGRHDEEIGAVTIGNLRGDLLANALMKATTKAKRRVTLSICGLGMLDETELETIPSARAAGVETIPQGVLPAAPVPEPSCDKAKWNRAWHAAVKGSNYATDEGRHDFLEWFTEGACSSLSEYLDTANDEEAESLVATAIEQIRAGAAAVQPEPAF